MVTTRNMPTIMLLCCLLVITKPATAQEQADLHPYLTKRFYAGVGIFLPDRKVELRVDGSQPGIGSGIDISSKFRTGGTEEEANFELGWRFGKKWMVRGQYFDVGGYSGAVLDEDVSWGDYTFNAGTNVSGGSRMSVTRVFFGRRFRSTDVSEFGIGFGLHLLEIDAFIRGQAFINGQDAGVRLESVGTQGPLPNIGAWYLRSLSPRLALSLRMDWLSASIDKYDGQIINAGAGLNYALAEHFGLGLSYNFFELDVGVDDPPWQGRVDHRFRGAHVYISAYW